MVIAVFLITLILIAPLIFSVYFYYDNSVRKAYFAIYLFGFIKLINGYTSIRKAGGTFIHISNKKALIFELKSIKGIESGPKLLKAITINSFYFSVYLGVDSASFLMLANLIIISIQNFAKINDKNGGYSKINADLIVYNENLTLKAINFKVKVTFNLISLLILYILKEFNNAKRKKIKLKRQFTKHA